MVAVVVPARNEAENLAELLPEIAAALGERPTRSSSSTTAAATTRPPSWRGLPPAAWRPAAIAHRRSLGKSAAVMTGVVAARAPIVVTLDGDGQNDPRFIPDLIRHFDDPKVGLVAGQRVGRKSSLGKKIGSRIANRLRRALLKDATRDTGCGVKAFRREPYLKLPYFENMHRFLPALFLGDGWRIAHIDVVDRPRQHGASHYGILDRLAVGIPDLFGVWWLLRRRRRSPFRVEHDA